ncbi:hypothetical protein GBAR_LOCUS3244 [Geodia barretti]|uniref:Uncharacterized protein n=1 Tax=Geodia barretti TaxID=519541 RepID=A0AA35W880_GEOBA|nr:hypothetical protein GBAR_LOCUS3244 [Geodia barretti]
MSIGSGGRGGQIRRNSMRKPLKISGWVLSFSLSLRASRHLILHIQFICKTNNRSLVVSSLGDPDVGFKGELIERNIYVSYRTSGCRFLRGRKRRREK